MIKIAKKILSLLSLFAILSFFAWPAPANALVPPLLQYGGFNSFSIPCTCSEDVFWSFYTPLYLSSVPMFGPISYVGGASWLFAEYIPPIESESWYTGAYIPGIPACWMYAGYFCFPLKEIGVTSFTGTSLPGGE